MVRHLAEHPFWRRGSPGARNPKERRYRLEETPGTGRFTEFSNPLDPATLCRHVKLLETRDLHSISFTGGEPLLQADFLREVSEHLVSEGYTLFLETNGSLPECASRVADLFEYCCCDIKDESSGAASDWTALVEKEFETIHILIDTGVKTFAKVVVTADTKPENIEWYAKELAKMKCPLCIQVVTPLGGARKPMVKQLFEFTETASKHLSKNDVSLSIQAHKVIGIL
ncbi:MAG: radical SAM protein [Candidatus Freyrarchaeum guaymaensis]|nr:4Fe-4S cluster-binding domain-containing protein [Candidatus Sigynarchaeota archaeon]